MEQFLLNQTQPRKKYRNKIIFKKKKKTHKVNKTKKQKHLSLSLKIFNKDEMQRFRKYPLRIQRNQSERQEHTRVKIQPSTQRLRRKKKKRKERKNDWSIPEKKQWSKSSCNRDEFKGIAIRRERRKEINCNENPNSTPSLPQSSQKSNQPGNCMHLCFKRGFFFLSFPFFGFRISQAPVTNRQTVEKAKRLKALEDPTVNLYYLIPQSKSLKINKFILNIYSKIVKRKGNGWKQCRDGLEAYRCQMPSFHPSDYVLILGLYLF